MTSDWTVWHVLGIASHVMLWILIFFLGFLLLGTLRSLGLLRWRMEQLEATTPSRLGRSGLKAGRKAPDFALPNVAGREVALHDFTGRQVFLVFTQSGCGPCHDIMPELTLLGRRDLQVLVVNRGDMETTRQWASELQAQFPVLVQDGLDLSKKYGVFATPFAFLIDEKGVIASKGIIGSKRHIEYVLSAPANTGDCHGKKERHGTEKGESKDAVPDSFLREEVEHV